MSSAGATVELNIVTHIWVYSGNVFAVSNNVEEASFIAEQVIAIGGGLA